MKILTTAAILMGALAFNACTSSPSNQAQQQASAPVDAHGQAPVNQEPMVAEPVDYIPDFTFYILKNGIKFQKSDLKLKGNQVFILFDPKCHHCQFEAQMIGKNIEQLKDIQLYFISMNDPGLMATFLPTFAKTLVDHPQVEVLYDRNQEFINKFHVPSQFPATYVYGTDGQLKVYWEGEQPEDRLLTLLKQ
jgi:hypothetical protein